MSLPFREIAIVGLSAAWAAGQVGSPASQPAGERYWKKDPIALRQEIDAFTSLQDGQPAAPGDWEMQLDSGWMTRSHHSDPVLIEPVLKYTPHRYTNSGYEFFEAMQLSLQMPLDTFRGDVEGNGDMLFGWQERWVAEHDGIPTISTLAEVRMPNGHNSSGADGTFTGIVAKDFGPGTMYLNGWVATINGDSSVPLARGNVLEFSHDEDSRHFQWGFRTGYKWRVAEKTSLIADYVHQAARQTGHANSSLLELAAEFRTKHHLAFGPGLMVGLDGNEETPRLAAGFRIVYLFNARNPPPE
jgi:hypothetical protein